MVRSLLLTTLGLVAFAATLDKVDELAPERLKIEWFRTLKDDVDVVFLGSSHIYRQIDPVAFDRSMAASGGSSSSFNFGVPGMRLPEIFHMVHRILAMQPDRLRWLVLEAGSFRTDMEIENDLTERQIYWHDPNTTCLLLQGIAQKTAPLPKKWNLGWRHLTHCAYQVGNLGRGSGAFLEWLQPLQTTFQGQPGLGQNGNGYLPLDAQKDRPNFRKRRQDFLQDQAGYFSARRSLKNAGDGGPPATFLADAIQQLTEETARAGVQIAWLLHPGVEREPGWRQLAEQKSLVHLLRFDEPETWPALYRPDHRFDLHHLNAKGAEIFSTELAQQFLPLFNSDSN